MRFVTKKVASGNRREEPVSSRTSKVKPSPFFKRIIYDPKTGKPRYDTRPDYKNQNKPVSAPKVEEPPKKKDEVYWPTATAFDRQLVEVGVPFIRKKEKIMVKRDPKTGVLTSGPYYGSIPKK